MDIYIDVLFMENLIINYSILLITKKIINKHTVPTKVAISAIIGSIYVVLMIIFPNLKLFYTLISKICLSIIMVLVAFSPNTMLDFVKTIAIFYVSTFVIAGSMLFFIYANKNGGLVKNGVIYMFANPKKSVVLMSIITVVLVINLVISHIRLKVVNDKLLVPMSINFDNKGVNVNAMLDTGASLNDPFSNLPIILVEFSSIKEILPLEIREIFLKAKSDDLDFITKIITESKWFKRFRVIPFNSLGNKNGMLIGFKADSVKFFQMKKIKELKNVIVAIYDEFLTNNNSYEALIGLDLYNKLV